MVENIIPKMIGGLGKGDDKENQPHTSFVEKLSTITNEQTQITIRHYLNAFYLDKILAKVCYLIGAIATIVSIVSKIK